jgi:hypothetical protein
MPSYTRSLSFKRRHIDLTVSTILVCPEWHYLMYLSISILISKELGCSLSHRSCSDPPQRRPSRSIRSCGANA